MGKNIKKKKVILSLKNWHGRTMGAQLMSGNKSQKKWIGYDDKYIYHIPFPYPWVTDKDKIENFTNKVLKKLSKI